ncbi:hypothetical protein [Sphingomonas sp. MMS24-J13]|uniref:hypothetical protein n=1 Tax=Sphingomonas sp. MMS24-J13 TaxID=3238686 RepID=UPI00384D7CBC
MAGILKPALIAGLLSIVVGLFLGETTVEAMQVRHFPAADDVAVNTSLIDDGVRWAAMHHPADADACPQPTLLFQWGCVMGTTN